MFRVVDGEDTETEFQTEAEAFFGTAAASASGAGAGYNAGVATATSAKTRADGRAPNPVAEPAAPLNLRARALDRAALLEWETPAPTASAKATFAVERWMDGTFAPVGTVDAPEADSAGVRRYALQTRVPSGRHRFRVTPLGGSPEADGREVSVVAGLDGAFALSEVHPNPLSGAARLTLMLAAEERVRAEVYDALGRRVAVLHDGPLAPEEEHALVFDGRGLASGLYLVRVTGESFAQTRRALVVR